MKRKVRVYKKGGANLPGYCKGGKISLKQSGGEPVIPQSSERGDVPEQKSFDFMGAVKKNVTKDFIQKQKDMFAQQAQDLQAFTQNQMQSGGQNEYMRNYYDKYGETSGQAFNDLSSSLNGIFSAPDVFEFNGFQQLPEGIDYDTMSQKVLNPYGEYADGTKNKKQREVQLSYNLKDPALNQRIDQQVSDRKAREAAEASKAELTNNAPAVNDLSVLKENDPSLMYNDGKSNGAFDDSEYLKQKKFWEENGKYFNHLSGNLPGGIGDGSVPYREESPLEDPSYNPNRTMYDDRFNSNQFNPNSLNQYQSLGQVNESGYVSQELAPINDKGLLEGDSSFGDMFNSGESGIAGLEGPSHYDPMESKQIIPEDQTYKERTNVMLDKKNKFAQAWEEDKSQIAFAGKAALQGVGNFAGWGDRLHAENEVEKELSNVFNTHGEQDTNRGDYLTNTTAMGRDFRPDSKYGSRGKIYQSGGEYDMSDEEMEELRNLGYTFDVI